MKDNQAMPDPPIEIRDRVWRKEMFIKQLAHFLVHDQAAKSIWLEMEGNLPETPMRRHWAKEWATVWGATPLFGYPTEDEAVRVLTQFLK